MDTKMRLTIDELTNILIRQRYTLSQELAILRQRDTKQSEYQEYYTYCESCKIEAKKVLNMEIL